MNFRDEYKRDFESIKLDDDFRNKLESDMNKISPARSNFRVYATVLAAAAVLALVVGIGHFSKVGTTNDIGVKAEGVTTEATNEGIFVQEKWYGDATTDDAIYEEFVGLIESGTLEKLYCSKGETFSDEDILEAADADKLMQKLATAVAMDKEAEGASVNYMAVFENGEIIEFQIFEGGYVKLNDIKTVYQYEK